MRSSEVLVAQLRRAGCVYAEDEAELLAAAAGSDAELAELVERRVAGAPLEQVLGWAEFCGLRVPLRPGVFVPRRRTELLVREALALSAPEAVVVELCCGSGAIALVLSTERPDLALYACDLDPAAVDCARANLQGRAAVSQGDLYAALPSGLRGRVQVLVANAPYVPTTAIALMPAEARDHEPAVALDGGVDGLAVLRWVVAEAPDWLAPGGHLVVECSEGQLAPLMSAVDRAGLDGWVVRDPAREATALVAQQPAGEAA